MDQLFSLECKSLIAKSREMAIILGYDYISTVHIFLADCETSSPTSIKKFAFTDEDAYIKFKTGCTLPVVNYLDNITDTLPLTKEAEVAIRWGDKARKLTGFDITHPFHIIIGCFKAKDSILADCFKSDPNVTEKLMEYYKNLGIIPVESKTGDQTISKESTILHQLLKLFKK